MNRRKCIAAVTASLGMLLLIFDSRCVLESAHQATELCIKTVIPSLFPFLFLSGVVTGALWGTHGQVLRIGAWILNIPAGVESLLLSGFLGGYPAGAITIGEIYRGGKIKKETAQRLLCYCSNAGPAFLFGMMSAQFPTIRMVWRLWGIHLLSAAMVGTIVSRPTDSAASTSLTDFSISQNMFRSVKSMGMICGWILLFRIIIGFLDKWILWLFPDWLRILIWGFLELSNGCCVLNQIGDITLRFITASGMLSFGGVCVAMQTSSAITGLSIKGYLAGKMLQMVFSILLAAGISCGYGYITCLICAVYLLLPKLRKKRSSNPGLFGV